jgi:2-polyprenyl-3-methyl-5-hydroxy-6-metoxy-1,4-benzoquinol methylase
MTVTTDPAHDLRRDALASRMFESTLGAFDLLAMHLGLDLGLYRSLADDGPASAPELAARTGIDRRYSREWLEHQAVAGILDVDDQRAEPESRRYSLPAGHAEAILDPDSLAAVAPLARFVLAGARTYPRLLDAYRGGGGVAWDAYPGLVEAQELANRPLFTNLLATEWLPAIPDVHARLTGASARVADLGCGAGWSTIAIARGYPNAVVDGIDMDAESIDRARANAATAGIEDRARFVLLDAARSEGEGAYDLVTIFEAVHDLSRPVEVLAAAHRLLAPGGTLLVVDERVAETFMAPGDEVERLMYSYSVLFCLANSLADQPSVGTGTVMRPATLAAYAEAAGFSRVTTLPIEHDVFRLYRLDP